MFHRMQRLFLEFFHVTVSTVSPQSTIPFHDNMALRIGGHLPGELACRTVSQDLRDFARRFAIFQSVLLLPEPVGPDSNRPADRYSAQEAAIILRMIGLVFNNWEDVEDDVDEVAENPGSLRTWHDALSRLLHQPAPPSL